jgi:sec-independent protein translocase protein TatB
MMGIGPGEMILIAGIALVVIGPERFPEFAKIVMRTFRDLRGYVDDVKGELRKELQPVKKEIDDVSRYKPEDYIDALTDGSSGESDYDDVDDPYGYGSEYDDGYGTTETRGPSAEGSPSAEGAPSAEDDSGDQSEQATSADSDWSEFANHTPEGGDAPEDPTAADEAQEHAGSATESQQDQPQEEAAAEEPDSGAPPERLDG